MSEVADKGKLAAQDALVKAKEVKDADRPTKDKIKASLVLTPKEYEDALAADPDYHDSFDVVLGEPAVIDGYLVFDDSRLPGPVDESL